MTRQSTDDSYVFFCPYCDEQIRIDSDIRQVILAEGCIVCDGDITPSAFDQIE